MYTGKNGPFKNNKYTITGEFYHNCIQKDLHFSSKLCYNIDVGKEL